MEEAQVKLDTYVVRTQCLVVDGGGSNSTSIPRPPTDIIAGDKHLWLCLFIAEGDLHILDCKDQNRGISVVTPSGSLSFHLIVKA